MMGYYDGYWGGFGSIFMLLFWVAVIWGVVALIKTYGRGDRMPRGNNALDILKERYAKGEINKQEYEEKKKDLMS